MPYVIILSYIICNQSTSTHHTAQSFAYPLSPQPNKMAFRPFYFNLPFSHKLKFQLLPPNKPEFNHHLLFLGSHLKETKVLTSVSVLLQIMGNDSKSPVPKRLLTWPLSPWITSSVATKSVLCFAIEIPEVMADVAETAEARVVTSTDEALTDMITFAAEVKCSWVWMLACLWMPFVSGEPMSTQSSKKLANSIDPFSTLARQ